MELSKFIGSLVGTGIGDSLDLLHNGNLEDLAGVAEWVEEVANQTGLTKKTSREAEV